MDEIQIMDVRSISDTSLDTIDITGYDANESAAKELKESTGMLANYVYSKPTFTYSTLISLAFKNSNYNRLAVCEIYAFICKHFPFFQPTERSWKSAVRHNLCMNPCFMRFDPYNFEEPDAPVLKNMRGKKGLTWSINPAKQSKVEMGIKRAGELMIAENNATVSMRHPEDIHKILAGQIEQMQPSEMALFVDDSDEEESVTKALLKPEKKLVFTQFEDGMFPLVTLYSKRPSDHKSYSGMYPLVL